MKLVFVCLLLVMLEACTLMDPKTRELLCKLDVNSGINCKLRF